MVVPGAFFPVDNAPEKPKPQRENRETKADKTEKGEAGGYLPAVNPYHFKAHEHLAEGLPLPAMQRQKIYRDEQGKGEQEKEKAEED